MDIQMMVNDFLARFREDGIDAQVIYCLSKGEIISFEIKIVGFFD